MRFTEENTKELCAAQFRSFQERAEEARLNGSTAASILGISRSRYQQLCKDPSTCLQTHIFLNLLVYQEQIKRGLADEWLPVKSLKGKGQQEALDKLIEASEHA